MKKLSLCMMLVLLQITACSRNTQPVPTSTPTQVIDIAAGNNIEIDLPTVEIQEASTEQPSPTATITPTEIPPTEIPFPTLESMTYVVQPGDTLDIIAGSFGVSTEEIIAANGITDPDFLNVGDVLIIPGVSDPQTVPTALVDNNVQVLGYSTGGHPIHLYRFGNGPIDLVLIGGIHGGFEWNSIILAYQVIDYLAANPEQIPPELSVFIIPALNADGQYYVTGKEGRFDASDVSETMLQGRLNNNNVDINRNWDCNWEPIGYMNEMEFSAGTEPFSEIETQILRDFLITQDVDAVVFWHSVANAVYPGGCNMDFEPSIELGEVYSDASGYKLEYNFTAYIVTGVAIDWLSTQGIPGIEVELSVKNDPEFARNLDAVLAVFDYLVTGSSSDDAEN